jgi:hypothetical protein
MMNRDRFKTDKTFSFFIMENNKAVYFTKKTFPPFHVFVPLWRETQSVLQFWENHKHIQNGSICV